MLLGEPFPLLPSPRLGKLVCLATQGSRLQSLHLRGLLAAEQHCPHMIASSDQVK